MREGVKLTDKMISDFAEDLPGGSHVIAVINQGKTLQDRLNTKEKAAL